MNGKPYVNRPKRNQDIRSAIDSAGLRYWWVAEELGIASGTLSNRLRKELPLEEKQEILTAVQRLAARLGGSASGPGCQELTLEARASIPSPGWRV